MTEKQDTLSMMPLQELKVLDIIDGYEVRPGFYTQNGATALSNSCVNFTVQSQGATDANCFYITEERQNPSQSYLFPNATASEKYIP